MAVSAQEGAAARRRALNAEAEELYSRAKGRLVAGDEDAARTFLTVRDRVRMMAGMAPSQFCVLLRRAQTISVA